MKFRFWPHGIIAGFTCFVIFMLTIVFVFSRQDNPLVIQDYYKDEIQFREKMKEMENTAALSARVSLDYLPGKEIIHIMYPDDFKGSTLNGNIWFYRPSDKKMDFNVAVDPGNDLQQIIPANNLSSGLWRVKLSWNDGSFTYYDEFKLMVEK